MIKVANVTGGGHLVVDRSVLIRRLDGSKDVEERDTYPVCS